jgi:hypothetical protein
MVNTISCPSLCVFAPLREALPGLYHQSPEGVSGEAASEQAVTDMRDTRALLLHSKKWTKSRQAELATGDTH